MANPTVLSTSKCKWVSQHDFGIIMICMDHYETSPPFHPMIPIASILFHLIILVTPSLSSHFTPCLLHYSQVIPQSSLPTPRAYLSHNQCLHVPCPSYGHLYVAGIRLIHHQTSCISHMQSSIFVVLMPSTLLSSLPFPTWTWIASLNIMNVFHFDLPFLCSYHHIPYVFCVEIQRVLHIPLT